MVRDNEKRRNKDSDRCQRPGRLPNHIIAWRGPSVLDGQEILVVLYAFKRATNGKTGRLIEAAVLLAHVKPSDAAATGRDRAICGDCPGRLTNWNFCYRSPGHDIDKTWEVIRNMQAMDISEVCRIVRKSGLPIRFGSYGDFAAVPFELLDALALAARKPDGSWNHTGYSHQWSNPNFDPRVLAYLDASIEFAEEREEIERLFPGARTHRLLAQPEHILPGEVFCLGGTGKDDVHCCDCLSCRGVTNADGPDRAVVVHNKTHLKALRKYLANPGRNIRHVHPKALAAWTTAGMSAS